MKAAFALLANTEIHNLVRELQWEIHQKYRTGTIDCRLPPHISLKQPFAISNLDPLEEYINELAKTTIPFEVTLTELQLSPSTSRDRCSGKRTIASIAQSDQPRTKTLLPKERANGWRYPLVGGTRERHFDGTNSKPPNLPENAATPTTTAPTHFVGDRVHAVLGAF